METYFEISKPIGVEIRFEDILKRTNSSFVLTLRLPSSLNHFPVQVSYFQFKRAELSRYSPQGSAVRSKATPRRLSVALVFAGQGRAECTTSRAIIHNIVQ